MVLRFLLIILCWLSLAHPAVALDAFKRNNPDGKKYEFGRSYITALGYLYRINARRLKNTPDVSYAKDDNGFIKANINGLALSNADLRIVKNYMVKYLTGPNQLMRKVADILIIACDAQISLNNLEKVLWVQWSQVRAARQDNPKAEKEFIRQQRELALKYKEAEKEIIAASSLMTKALISQDDPNGKGHRLAITAQEREKLLKKLDSFAKENLDWGLRSGQSTMDASVAVIREVLEDSIWVPIDEK